MIYEVVSTTGSGVVLQREDGSRFERKLAKGEREPARGELYEIPDPAPEPAPVEDEIPFPDASLETGVADDGELS